MDRAINKSTGKLISAFEVYNNGSYQNLTKGEWIAPKDSISNYEDVTEEDLHVHYVREKEYQNWRGTYVLCNPCFAIYPGSKANTIAESKEHKTIKNWLFNRLKNDDIFLRYSKGTKPHKYENKLKLSELPIDWNNYEIEITTKGYKYLRADILIPFIKSNEILGNGIFFEIQLSNQSEKITFNRSIERALHGYSTVWLFKNDFEYNEDMSEIELKNNLLDVHSFSSELHYSGKSFIRNLKIVVEEQCRFLDNKINELKDKKEETMNEIIKLQEEFNPRVIPYKSCNNGYMIFKVTPTKQKELYECNNCKKVIWIK